MLKITTYAEERSTTLKLEGRLVGPWVQEVDRCWSELAAAPAGPIVLDLTGVTFVDAPGKELLIRMRRGGIEFRATGCLMRCIVEEIAKECR
jgi:anti-anti-sigma regulatory factor